MSLDIGRVAAAKLVVEAALARTSGSGAKFWNPANGKNRIRILPPWTDEGPHKGDAWREVHQHWRVNDDHKGPILCPAKTPGMGGECPICAYVDVLKSQTSDPVAMQMASDIRAKRSYLMQLIDYANPAYTAGDVADYTKANPGKDVPFESGEPKIQVYSAPISVMDGVMNAIVENELDITHLTKGKDLVLDKQYNKSNPMLTKYAVTLLVKEQVAPITAAEFEQKKVKIDQVGRVYDTAKLRELLATGVGADAELPALNASNKGVTNNKLFISDNLADDDDLSLVLPADEGMDNLQAEMQAALKNKKK